MLRNEWSWRRCRRQSGRRSRVAAAKEAMRAIGTAGAVVSACRIADDRTAMGADDDVRTGVLLSECDGVGMNQKRQEDEQAETHKERQLLAQIADQSLPLPLSHAAAVAETAARANGQSEAARSVTLRSVRNSAR